MFNWLSNLLMSSMLDAAFNAAIHSAELASNRGMHQIEEPENLQKVAKEYKASLNVMK